MRIWDKLFNREPRPGTFASGIEPPAENDRGGRVDRQPVDVLGDPLRSLTQEKIRTDFRIRLNRGDYTVPTWALREALIAGPILSHYEKLWVDSLAGLDWTIKTRAGLDAAGKALAERQKVALREKYDRLSIQDVVSHLARAYLYGFAVLRRIGDGLIPVDPWNVTRHGWRGKWLHNPESRQITVRGDQTLPQGLVEFPADAIRFEVDAPAILEYLSLYLTASENSAFWDRFNERRSWNQVVVLSGRVPENLVEEFRGAAAAISAGRSGFLARGDQENPTEVQYPPAGVDPMTWSNRLSWVDEQACRALFGSSLIATTSSGSGTLAGGAHSETATRRIRGAAARISACLQTQFDRPILRAAALIADGVDPLVWFELTDRAIVDPKQETDLTVSLASAGFIRDAAEVSERTGMRLTRGGAAPVGPGGAIPATPAAGPGSAPGAALAPALDPTADVQAQALNGAQVTSLVDVVKSVTAGELPRETAAEIIQAAFPTLTPEAIGRMIDPLSAFSRPPSEPTQKTAVGLNDPASTLVNRDRLPGFIEPTPTSRLFGNRAASETATAVLDKVAAGRVGTWEKGLRDFIDDLVARLESGKMTGDELDAIEDAVRSLSPDVMDSEALAQVLAARMIQATIEGKAAGTPRDPAE
jgi:hypothetical protein